MYCKARDEAIAQSEGGAETKPLDSDKYEFVQSYLQNIQETYSMTTETTDSGIRTHGEPSDVEMQDISGKYHLLISHCLGSQIVKKLLTKRDVNSAGYRASEGCYSEDNNCPRIIVILYEPYRLMPLVLLNSSKESY